MPDTFALVFIAVTAGSAAIGAGRELLERRRARRALTTRPPLEASSPEGVVVRVTGIVRATERTLVAPLSARTCVVVRSRVAHGHGWATRRAVRPREILQIVPFELERPDGSRVAITGNHVLLDLPPIDLPKPRGRLSPERTRREELALRHGISPRKLGNARFEETAVEPGMTVSIAGLIMKDTPDAPPSDELGFRDAPAPSLRLAGNADHPLAIGTPLEH